jgi:hypothetical protein
MSRKKFNEKIDKLEKLFKIQINLLKKRGCPEKIIHILEERLGSVITACLKINLRPDRIPFLPVITPAYCSLEELMAMVRNGKTKGQVYDQVEKDKYPIVDAVGSVGYQRLFFDPYYIINIEDGTKTKGLNVRQAHKKIISDDRSSLTTAECISLSILTDVLSRHYLWTLGSRWRFEDRVPKIELTAFGGTPQLYHEDIDTTCEMKWGTPSCAMRVR